MPKGKEYPTREAAQKYADTFDDATGPTASVMKMTRPDGDPYWVVMESKPPNLGEYFKDAKENKKNIGGMVDELGYMHGGMTQGKRGPIKYATGGAVRGKRFVGTF